MSCKGRRQNGDYFDTTNGYVFAEHAVPLPENLKSKIETVKETFPSKSKDDIALVLQMCDYSVDKTLSCFAGDGAEDILKDWSTQGKKGKNGFIGNKNKKKKKANKKAKSNQDSQNLQNGVQPEEDGSVISETLGTEESSQASEKDLILPNGDSRVLWGNTDEHSQCSSRKSSISYVSTSEVSEIPLLSSTSNPSLLPHNKAQRSTQDSLSSSAGSTLLNSERIEKEEKHDKKKFSAKDAIKRSVKDLQRSAVSIARFHLVLEEGCESAEKQLKKSFTEIKKCVEKREATLVEELAKLKSDGADLLNSRQEDAAVLKLRCDRVGGMTELMLQELRADIKHFISDRKTDEEIAKASKFIEDRNLAIQVIETFAHVPPLKALYRKRSAVSLSEEQPPHTAAHVAEKPIKPADKVLPQEGRNKARPGFTENRREKETSSHKLISTSELKEQAATHNRLKQALQQQGLTDIQRHKQQQHQSYADRQKDTRLSYADRQKDINPNASSAPRGDNTQAVDKKQNQARSFRRRDRRRGGFNQYNSKDDRTTFDDNARTNGQFSRTDGRQHAQNVDIKPTPVPNSVTSQPQDRKPREHNGNLDGVHKPNLPRHQLEGRTSQNQFSRTDGRQHAQNVDVKPTPDPNSVTLQPQDRKPRENNGHLDGVHKPNLPRHQPEGKTSQNESLTNETRVSNSHPSKDDTQSHTDINGNTVDRNKQTVQTHTENKVKGGVNGDMLPQRGPNNNRRRRNRDKPHMKPVIVDGDAHNEEQQSYKKETTNENSKENNSEHHSAE